MMKIIQRYLGATFIGPFLISMIFFVTFLLTFEIFKIIRVLISKGVDLLSVFELVGHIAVTFLPIAVPLSALFATIYTLGKLSEDSEIVAMRSFGVTKFKLFMPFLILGLLIASAIFSLNRNLIPYSQKQFTNSIIRLTSKGMLTDIQAENFFTEIPMVTLFAQRVKEKGKRLEDVYIHLRNENEDEERVIVAQTGILVKESKNEWELPSFRLVLQNGNIIKTYKDKHDVEKILFESYDFPLINSSSRPDFVTKDSMRTNAELWKLIKERKIASKLQKKQNVVQRDHLKSELEFWSRINTPFQCLVFIFLGFGLGIKKGRGRGGNSGVLVMIILVLYYVIFFLDISLSKKGNIPPVAAIFLPTVLSALVASWFYKGLDWSG